MGINCSEGKSTTAMGELLSGVEELDSEGCFAE